MFRKLLEVQIGPISHSDFVQIMDLTSIDIKVNRIGFNRRTSLSEAVHIASICYLILQRAQNVA